MTYFISETPFGYVARIFKHMKYLQSFGFGVAYLPVNTQTWPPTPGTQFTKEPTEKVRYINEDQDWSDEWDVSEKNPRNWPAWKKMLVVTTIAFYTFVVYSGSAIYVVSIPGIMLEFQITEQRALLGLSLYILSYGIGPLLWAPLTEVSRIGRNPVYFGTAIMFFIISIPTAAVKNFAGFLALRFFQGLFGSPCIANGGASMHDIFNDYEMPFALAIWISFAYAGPAFGPALVSHLVMRDGWRWSMWMIAMLALPVVILITFLPETYGSKVRHRLALKSPHAQPGVARIVADNKSHLLDTFKHSLVKPLQIMVQDPAILFINTYVTFCYAAYYTFMNSFPLAYLEQYKFSIGDFGLTFTCIIAGIAVAAPLYCCYVYYFLNPVLRDGGMQRQEDRLRPALIAVWLPPIGLVFFGWTTNSENIHWSIGMIGVAVFSAGVFIVLQCLSVYVLRSYPDYAASLFAANDFSRSALAAAAVHFGEPLYRNLGLGGGSSVLGGISAFGIIGMWVLYKKGETLRKRSRFAVS